MASVNPPFGDGHIPYLVDMANRRMQQDLSRLVNTARYPELRGSHFRILAMIPAQGTRPSALAAAAQMTRPAVGELVAHLREHGYAEVEPDASDGRAVMVHLTRRGRQAAAEVERAVVELKRQWSHEVGAERLQLLLDVLAALTGAAAGTGRAGS